MREHGTRALYQRGCRCLPCRSANARYWTQWRQQRQAGIVPLGAIVSAARCHIELRALRGEYQTAAALGTALGWHRNTERVRQARRIRLRTALKVHRLFRQASFVWVEGGLSGSPSRVCRDTLSALGK